MPVNIPTLKQLQEDIVNDLQSKLNITIPFFGKAFLLVLAGVEAAKMRLLYLHLESVQKNIFIDTADSESIGGTLERFGRVKLGRGRFAATSGRYLFTITGSIDGVVPANTIFRSKDNISYINDDEFTMSGSSDTIELRSLETGLKVRLSVGQELTMTVPLQDVDKLVTVLSEEDQPIDEESIEEYREAGVQAFQLEPQGGAPSDYRIWARDAQGVAQTYPFAKSGESGAVNIYVEATIADSLDGKGTPTPAILAEVESVIEFDPDITKPLDERGRRPAQAWPYFLPIIVNDIEIIINNPVGITDDVKPFILTAIQEFVDSVRPYVAGADIPKNRADVMSKSKLAAKIYQAIPSGAYFRTVTMLVNSMDTEELTLLEGNIPFLVDVTYN